MWDNGKEFFDLISNPITRWDGRDCFHIEPTQKLVKKLSELDPTHFVAKSYLATLMTVCMPHIKFGLHQLLGDKKTSDWLSTFANLQETTEAASSGPLKRFITSVTSKLSNSDFDIDDLSETEVSLLLRDALCATEMDIHWLYANDSTSPLNARPSTTVLRYPSIEELEIDVLNNNIPFGIYVVGIDTIIGNKNKVSNLFLYFAPDKAFTLSNMHFAFTQNQMVSEDTKENSYNRFSEPATHFPDIHNYECLPENFNKEERAFLDISNLKAKQSLWSMMVLELISIMAQTITPLELSCSTALLESYSNGSKKDLLPVTWTPPFELEHMSIDDLICHSGINSDPNREFLLSIIKGLTIEHLLPDAPMLGFDLNTFESAPEHSVSDTSKSLNRYGNQPARMLGDDLICINLLPKPTSSFGTANELRKATNKILIENFTKVLTLKSTASWSKELPSLESWFKRKLEENIDNLKACLDENKHVCNIVPNNHVRVFNVQYSNSPYIQYSLCKEYEKTDRHDKVLSLRAIKISTFDDSKNIHIGFKTKKRKALNFLVVPMDWKDLCTLLDCEQSELPETLQTWHRTSNSPWNTRENSTPLIAHVYI
jgi:hypothetical protein